VAMFFLLGLSAGPVSDPSLPLYFGSGVVAICAMILPGISGSFVLLMIGMYQAVIGAVSDRDFLIMGVFAFGAVIGLALFSTLLDRLLRDHHDTVMAVLVGMMAGSLRVLWPWPEGTGGTTLGAPANDVILPILLALAGALVVLALTGREEVIEEEAQDFGLATEVDP
jgi:putative membrane protein